MLYKLGSSGAQVRQIKDKLYALGYLKLKPTHDRFGADTDKAVRAFQSAKKLTTDGIVGPLTWAALLGSQSPTEDLSKSDDRSVLLTEEFIDYLEEQVNNHSIYVWGAQGQGDLVITESWIRSREKNTGKYKDGESYADAAVKYWNQQITKGYKSKLKAFDCSGLGVFWLLQKKLIKYDMTANSMRNLCTKINRKDLRKGDWVFRSGHIGYIVDDKLNVIEARGRRQGVCKTALTKIEGDFNYYGRPKIFT